MKVLAWVIGLLVAFWIIGALFASGNTVPAAIVCVVLCNVILYPLFSKKNKSNKN
jgi:hypothetical protein